MSIHKVNDGLSSPTFGEWLEWIIDLVHRYHDNDPTLTDKEHKEAKDFYDSIMKWNEKKHEHS